ncbi:RNA polymerase sigma factor [Candidatus Sumerlaeota bacterium]|nr:RNA polymerase sigma factor [Candidatus Sumerlaeota bacterium]
MQEAPVESIRSCRNGDVEAFRHIVDAYERPLFSYVCRFLGNGRAGSAPEDAVQDIFLKAYSSIRAFDPGRGCRFSTWLFAIAHNHCVSLLRKGKGEALRVDVDEGVEETQPDRRSPNPRDAAARRQAAQRVEAAVASLPETVRTAFVLRHYEEMSYEEIAEVLDCGVGAAKSRVLRAKERLARDLSDLL